MAKKRARKNARSAFVGKKKNKKVKKPAKKARVLNNKKLVKKAKRVKSVKQKKVSVKIKKIAKKAKKTAVKKIKVEEFPAESLFKARIKVIGIGGGGGSIVSEIGRSLEKATFVIADTDIRALKKRSEIKSFCFGQEFTHGLGTGVNVDLAKQAAESAKEKISEIFKDQDIIIFIASLGGGLGSGATQVFAQTAREFGGITLGIFTMPFKFEGKNKYRIAQNALKSLRQSLNVSLVIPNERIFKIIDGATPITSAFSTVNKSLIESLESLIDLIYSPGIINIDFADLRTILKGRGNTAFLNTAEESGKDRAEKICEKVLVNPLLQNSGFAAEKIMFNIAGSDNLSMFEVEKISSHISNLNPKAKIIFGISKNQKLKNKIKTTILMTGGEIKGLKEPEKIVEVPEVAPVQIKAKEPPRKEDKGEKEFLRPKRLKKKKPKIKLPPKADLPRARKNSKKKKEKPVAKDSSGGKSVSFIPVFEVPSVSASATQSRMSIDQINLALSKKTIRRSGLEIKKAEEQEEKKKMAQEKEWEIPAFLRRVKFKS